MKNIKKVLALVLAAAMMVAMSVTAFAQSVNSGQGGNATITISNASKGETYSVSKLFDATVTGTEGGSIAYTGTIPSGLAAYFQADSAGNISLKENVQISDETFQNALQAWAEENITAKAESDGSELTFTNLEYGYYVVTTTQGEGTITVNSTNPNATVVDKNSTEPVIPEGGGKKVDDSNVAIGQTVTYTITFKATNFLGAGEEAERVTAYKIEDTLPNFLSDINVTSIIVNDGEDHNVTTPFDDKVISIAWVDENGNSLYKNEALITITYTAKVTADAAIAGDGNKNEVKITPVTAGGDQEGSQLKTETIIKTYALAIKKVDDKGNPLSGATFQFPFAVAAEQDSNGYYIVDASAETQSASITTPSDGIIVIKGVKAGTYSITETGAPAGYNALTGPVSVTATETSATTTSVTKYIDANGNVIDSETNTVVSYENTNIAADALFVVNKTGSTLPSTGGTGTAVFYIIGAILVLGAGVILIARRRMNAR